MSKCPTMFVHRTFCLSAEAYGLILRTVFKCVKQKILDYKENRLY